MVKSYPGHMAVHVFIRHLFENMSGPDLSLGTFAREEPVHRPFLSLKNSKGDMI